MRETEARTDVRFGDEVRCQCTATGRYIGRHGGKHWALYISCMDDDLGLDEVRFDSEPQPNLPQPCDAAIRAASLALSHGLRADALSAVSDDR